jgi:hypothetical protein
MGGTHNPMFLSLESELTIFLSGTLGAVAPEIYRLYKKRFRRVRFTSFYYAISILFALLGGTVATILPTTSPIAAFYAGLNTPFFISGVLGRVSAETRSDSVHAMIVRFAWRDYLGLIFS